MRENGSPLHSSARGCGWIFLTGSRRNRHQSGDWRVEIARMGSDRIDCIDLWRHCICSSQPLCLQAVCGAPSCSIDCLPSGRDGSGQRHGGVPLTQPGQTAL